MIKASLNNPIAVLMVSIALVVFSLVVTPRMAVDTFPELTPPVLVVGTLAPGLGPKDVEKTLTWRIEKYVSATPGVDHVESVSCNNLSIVYVWLKWGTDLNAAQTLVQQQTAFAMSAVPKSLGVLPPFVLQYDPSNAPIVQVAVWGSGLSGPQLYDYAFNQIEPILEGISGVASASLNGGRQRQINIVVDPTAAQARGLTASDIANAIAQSNALLPSGMFLSQNFNSNVYTNAIPNRIKTIGDALIKVRNQTSVPIRDVARIEDGGSPETQTVRVNGENAVYLNDLAQVPARVTEDGKAISLGAYGRIFRSVGPIAIERNQLQRAAHILMQVERRDLGSAAHQLEKVLMQDSRTRNIAFEYVGQVQLMRNTFSGLSLAIGLAIMVVFMIMASQFKSLRLPFVMLCTIPVSLIGIVFALISANQGFSITALMGILMVIGIAVSNGILLIDDANRRMHDGLDKVEAILAAARSRFVPIAMTSLATIIGLVPTALHLEKGTEANQPLALAVVGGLTSSTLLSLFLVPVMFLIFAKSSSSSEQAM